MPTLLAFWLASTSIMPLAVGAGVGALGRVVLRPCGGGLRRLILAAALSALAAHLVLVGSGALRDGAMLDYGAVLLAAVIATTMAAGG